jgi:hypothetical protein
VPEAERTHSVVTALALTAALTVAVSGCGDDPGDGLPPPAASPPGSPATDLADGRAPALDLSPTERAAVDEARAQFDTFMRAYVEVSTADVPTAEDAETLFARVDREASGLLAQELRSEIVGRWAEGHRVHGALKWHFIKVVDVDLDRRMDGANFPEVGLRYCVDASNWVPIHGTTGEPVDEPGGRHLWTVAVVWSADWSGLGQGPEGWRIGQRDAQVRRPC